MGRESEEKKTEKSNYSHRKLLRKLEILEDSQGVKKMSGEEK